MKKLLPIIVILVAAIAGGGGGYFFKSMTAPKGGDEHAAADGEHGDDASDHGDAKDDGHGGKKDKKKKKKKDGHGGGHGESESSSTVYMKFGRQFVVPVVKNGQPRSMIIMDINIEVDSELGESIYAYEPRLRDAMLSDLLTFAGNGDLPQIMEDAETMDALRAKLLETARAIIGDGALQILIQDIGMQNY